MARGVTLQPNNKVDIGVVNARVDYALGDNRRAEWILIVMGIGIFLLGVAVVLVAYWARNPYVAAGSALTQGFLYFPVREIGRLRRDNMVLQVYPALIHSLPPSEGVKETIKLMTHLRGKAS